MDEYVAQLDQLAGTARREIPTDGTVRERAQDLATLLFEDIGYKGNVEEYGDPRNSYLNEVLNRQLGIPITLSVIYIEVAQQLNVPAVGVGLPGHFIVSIQDPKGEWYLDPFNGGKQLSVGDCAKLVQDTTGYEGAFNMDWLEPASPHHILARMLNNLKIVYVQYEKWSLAIEVTHHLRIVQPDNPDHLRDLGLIHRQRGALRDSVVYLERYLLQAGDSDDVEVVKQRLRASVNELARRN